MNTNSASKVSSEAGASLVEVMVAASILAIIALGVMTLFQQQGKSNNYSKFQNDTNAFNEEMRALLSSDVACSNTFAGIVANASTNSTIVNIKDGTVSPGVIRYSAGSTYANGAVKLTSMNFGQFVAGATNKGTLTLKSQMTSPKDVSGPKDLVREINISVEFDGSNLITNCGRRGFA